MESMKSLVVAAIIILVIIAGGIFFYSRGNNSTTNISSNSKKPIVTQLPTQQTNKTTNPTQSSQQVTSNGEQDISITKNGFAPNTVTVKLGTRIKWINNSGTMVSVNSSPYPNHSSYPAMNFGQFTNGSSVELVFDKTGTYSYVNDNNSQIGTIVVK